MNKKISLVLYLLLIISVFTGCLAENKTSVPISQSQTIEEIPPIEQPDYLLMRENLIKDYTHKQDCGCTITTQKIMEGTPYETQLTTISSLAEGKNVFVVGGVHGDEIAGYMAADIIKENFCPKSGKIYVISPANANGVKNKNRYVELAGDLNRAFPGSEIGEPESMLAYEIFSLIQEIKPDFLIDMHEAYIVKESRDFLGSSIIFTKTDGMEDFLMDFLLDTSAGKVCTEPFNFYNGAPKGSINNVVSTELNLPVITVETYREYPLDRRIYDHLDIFLYLCKTKELA